MEVKLGSVSEIQRGALKRYDLSGGRRIAVAHVGNDWFAFEDRCSHDDGDLAGGALTDGEVECPRHGARFDIKTGAATRMPAVAPIETYPVQIKGSDLWITISEES